MKGGIADPMMLQEGSKLQSWAASCRDAPGRKRLGLLAAHPGYL